MLAVSSKGEITISEIQDDAEDEKLFDCSSAQDLQLSN